MKSRFKYVLNHTSSTKLCYDMHFISKSRLTSWYTYLMCHKLSSCRYRKDQERTGVWKYSFAFSCKYWYSILLPTHNQTMINYFMKYGITGSPQTVLKYSYRGFQRLFCKNFEGLFFYWHRFYIADCKGFCFQLI